MPFPARELGNITSRNIGKKNRIIWLVNPKLLKSLQHLLVSWLHSYTKRNVFKWEMGKCGSFEHFSVDNKF